MWTGDLLFQSLSRISNSWWRHEIRTVKAENSVYHRCLSLLRPPGEGEAKVACNGNHLVATRVVDVEIMFNALPM